VAKCSDRRVADSAGNATHAKSRLTASHSGRTIGLWQECGDSVHRSRESCLSVWSRKPDGSAAPLRATTCSCWP
jgi:hypothetical protein